MNLFVASTRATKRHATNHARLLVLTMLGALLAIAIAAPGANAAYNILDFKMTPSNLQAGGHPNLHYHVDPDAAQADSTGGDDLKKVILDFPSGSLGNPEAANPKCTATQFSQDKCPASSYIGAMKVQLRLMNRTTVNAPGSVYVLSPPTPGSAITVGFIVRPPGYRLIFLKTEVTGVVSVRTGTEADYGLTLTVDNIPRTLTTTWGSSVASTIADISVDINARANTKKNGPYFLFAPTRCSASNTRATMTSYQNVVNIKNDSFTTTNCAAVPFNPTSSYTPSVSIAGQSTGMAATFTVPTADATIQQSHVRNIQTDLPVGTGLDFPAIGAVPALCPEAQLNLDQCPAGSKIGTVSAAVPFLPPTMTGDVYMITRGTSVVFGYILRGANSVKAYLKGQVTTVDADNDGAADFVRATALNMPQAPWSTATIDFTSKLIIQPVLCGLQTIKSQITGWSGPVISKTNTYNTTNANGTCTGDIEAPVVSISSPANGSTVNSASVTVNYTATDNVGVVNCNRANGSSATLVPGPNTITVSCTDAAGNTGSASVTVTYQVVDITPPSVSITAPAHNSVTGASSTTLTYTATDNSGVAPTCDKASGSSQPLAEGPNTITVTCTDGSGNSATASVTVTRDSAAPVVTITSPVDGSSTTASSVVVSYTVTDNVDSSPTCSPANGSSRTLSPGPNTITVTCADDAGNSGSASVTVTQNPNPAPVVNITSPANNTITSASSVTLNYTATDDSGIAPTCNKANGSSQPLVAGPNTISVTCTDNQGAPTTASVTVTRDNTAPVIVISAPANGLNTQAASTTLTYSVTDNVSSAANIVCNQASGTVVPLNPGSNTITVTCTDQAGNMGTASVTVFRDNTSPTLTITAPANNSVTAASSTTLTYTVSDNAPAAPTCNKANNSSQPLVAGPNTISVTCNDAAGNTTTQSVTVTRDNVAPVVTITSPANNTNTQASSIVVTYTATDNVTPSPSCSPASGSSVPLNNGANTITVTCTDGVGNVGSASVIVNRVSNLPPVVTITSPPNNLNTQASSVAVTFTATDDSGTTPSCNQTSGFVAPLNAGSNTITVTCTDDLGTTGSGSVTVFRDNAPPVVTITAPANNSVTAASSTTLAYTVTDNASGTPTCDKASGSSQPLAAGPNTITVTCTDAAGNSGSASVTVTRDNVAPVVSITSPPNNLNTQASSVTVNYTATDNVTPSPTCNRANGSSQALVAGSNTISVTCTDQAGNTGSASVTVFRDNTGPVITITAPANNSVTAAASTTLTYTATDNSGATPTCDKASGSSQPLVSGPNVISVTCTDPAGNASTASVTVNRDTVGPVITITAPANNSTTTQSSVTLTYTVTDNFTPAPTCDKANNSSQPLNIGPNTITVTCADNVGNSSTASVNVTRGNNPPINLTITAPANGTNTQAANVTLTYTVSGGTGTITCDKANNSSQPLAVGSNTITVNCSDQATPSPVTATASVTVFRDNTPPSVSITAPPNGLNTQASSVTLTYTAADNSGATPTCDKVSGSSQPLVAGNNVISVTCNDPAGNSATATVNVFRDNIAPTVTITAPANNLNTQASSVTLTYTVTDNAPAAPTCDKANSSSQPLAAGSNTISVTCTDAAGNATTQSVTVFRDNTAPTLTITAPANNTITQASSVTLTYTVTDNAPAAPTCNKASGSSQPLVAGSNTISVTCTDAAGNATTQSVTVVRDNTPPVVTITAPANNLNTQASSVTLTYTVTDNVTPSPTCDKASGSSQPLVAGSNTITVTCTDQAGNAGTASVTVFRDNVAPSITITAPANNSFTQASSTTLTYAVTDNAPAAPTCNKASGSSQPLVAGPNVISVTCTDAAGNSTTASVTVTRDNAAPVVTITAPVNNLNTQASSVTLTYTVTDNITPTPTCDKASGSSQPLVAGSNTITVTCTDQAGNAGTASVTVFRDNTNPVVTITAPINNLNTQAASVTLTYTATDNSGATPTCDKANNSSQPLVAGPNTISVTCTDPAGNSGTASVSVFRDNTPPSVTITAPANNTITAASSITLTYTVTDNAPAAPTCDKASGSSQPLVAGSNTISVTCTDAAGNSSTASVTVIRDNAPPVVTITSPANGASFAPGTVIPVNFTVTDNVTPSPTCNRTNGQTYTVVAGSQTITVTCTDQAGNVGSNSVTITGVNSDPVPNTTITTYAPPSATTAQTVTTAFTADVPSATFECRVDANAFAPCTSSWTIPVAGLTSPAEHTYEVRGVTSSGPDPTPAKGFIWIDDRAYNATASVTPQLNSITTVAGTENDAGRHPNIAATLSLQGYDDPQAVDITMPDGLMGSLKSVPKASRCSGIDPDGAGPAKAPWETGACPAASQIGTLSATATSTSDGTVTVNTGKLFLVDAPGLPSQYAAGIAMSMQNIVGNVTPNLGDVYALGYLSINDQGRNLKINVLDTPRQTTTGNRFHVRAVTLTVNGDVGGATNPLLTNPHFCGTIFGSRPDQKNFYGIGTGYNGSVTPKVVAPYVVDNCPAIGFNPAISFSLSNPVAQSTTGMTADVTIPFDHSPIRGLTVKLPPFIAPGFPSFGATADQCPNGSQTNVSPPSTTPQYLSFNPSTCPPQARVGIMKVTTPLLDNPMYGDVYLINASPIPYLGIDINPNVVVPAGEQPNPQGVTIGLVGTTTTLQYLPATVSDPPEPGTCNPDIETCAQAIQASFTSLPDVALNAVNMKLGGVNTNRVSVQPGNPILDTNILVIAAAGDAAACQNAGFNAIATFNPWRGGAQVQRTQLLQPTGCNQ